MLEEISRRVQTVIHTIQSGGIAIVTDDEDRENEGDLICAAEKITPEIVNFMVKEARGMLCVPLSQERANQLNLKSMVSVNRESQQTHFTVTVDAALNISTGISANDRAHTIKLLSSPISSPADFVQPGHINPLIAQKGGVLRRAGHTEAAVDLCRLANLNEVGVIIEIMNENGSMARNQELIDFSIKHQLPICSISDIIAYRRETENLVQLLEVVKMPTEYGNFDLHLYKSTLDDIEHVALVMGEIDPLKPTLVRVHSECLTGDIFHSKRCDCGPQLESAMKQISQAGSGAVIYMRGHEGRGIGLHAKILAYKLQENGLDTIDANLQLGYAMDLRDYGIGAQIIHAVGIRKIRLMTNNPKKIVGLSGHNLEIIEQVPLQSTIYPENQHYIETKRTRMGHLF